MDTSAVLRFAFARYSNTILRIVGLWYFARLLGPDRIGIFFLFQAVLGMSALGANLGLGGSLLKRMSEGEDRREFLGTGLILIGASTFIVMSLTFLYRNEVNQYIGADVAVLLIATIAAKQAFRLSFNILRGELQVNEAALLEVIQGWTWVGGGIVFLHYGFGPIGLVLSLLISFVLATIYGISRWETLPSLPSTEHVISLYDFAKYGIFAFMDSYVYNWADVLILGFLLSQTEVGAYEIAWRVTSVVVVFTSAIEATILPQISEWSANNHTAKIENQIPTAILGSVYFVIPALFGVFILHEEILRYTFGDQFVIAATALVILMAGKLIESIDRILKNVLSGIDRPDLRAVAVIASLILNIILNYFLIKQLGLTGAAIGTTVSFTVSTVLIAIFINRIITIRYPVREILWCIVCSIVMAGAIHSLSLLGSISSLPALMASIMAGAVVYMPLTLLHPEIRYLIKSLIPNQIDISTLT